MKLPKRLLKLGTGALSDAMGKRGAMVHDIRCWSGNPAMAGPAFTLEIHAADILMVAKAVSLAPEGSVLVIDGRAHCDTALWGDLTSLAAKSKGLAGVVIDGAVRDVRGMTKVGFPVYARAAVPSAGGAQYLGHLNTAVTCSGQTVRPGDWIVGDQDGVVVIPAEGLEDVVTAATAIVAAERQIERRIRAGEDICSILGIEGVIEAKKAQVFIPQLAATQKEG